MTQPDFLLSIYLRGGADGLTFLPPYDDATYQQRSATRLHSPFAGPGVYRALELVGPTANHPALGLAPALAPLKNLYDTGRLSFVHNVGSPDPTRSHFTQQFYTEMGWNLRLPGSSPFSEDGLWTRYQARVANALDPRPRAICLSELLADSFQGASSAAPVPKPFQYQFPGVSPFKVQREDLLSTMYGAPGGAPLGASFAAVQDSIDSVEEAMDLASTFPITGSSYAGPLGEQMHQAALFARLAHGPEIVHIDVGGWDTHTQQGIHPGIDGGGLYGRMADLAQNLEAFLNDMASNSARGVSVLVMTEFGRSVHENISRGTDHGRAGVAIVAGDGLQTVPSGSGSRGKVVANWIDFDPAVEGGDLQIGIDIRDVQGELMNKRMGLTAASAAGMFDTAEYTYTPRGLFRAL